MRRYNIYFRLIAKKYPEPGMLKIKKNVWKISIIVLNGVEPKLEGVRWKKMEFGAKFRNLQHEPKY